MKPRFSILIANYNNGKFFSDCYHSLIAQTETNWEAVILDDCSTDNSVEIISKMIENDRRFRLEKNEENRGVGFTKRRLVELSHSEICGFLDPDDALVPDAIEKMVHYHTSNPHVGLVYSNLVFCDAKLKPLFTHKSVQVFPDSESYYNFNGEISNFATFKKFSYNKTSGIDPYLKIAEDKDWMMKLCEVDPVLYVDENLYLYRRFSTSVSGDYKKNYFWHWAAIFKMAERRNIAIEDFFYRKITEQFVLPKTQPFEKTFSFYIYRIEKKIINLFRRK